VHLGNQDIVVQGRCCYQVQVTWRQVSIIKMTDIIRKIALKLYEIKKYKHKKAACHVNNG